MNKKTLKLKATDPATVIDWTRVDAAPLADMPDDDSPEITAAQMTELRPLNELLTGKTRITIMLDDAVLAAYKQRAGGRGYQTLINCPGPDS